MNVSSFLKVQSCKGQENNLTQMSKILGRLGRKKFYILFRMGHTDDKYFVHLFRTKIINTLCICSVLGTIVEDKSYQDNIFLQQLYPERKM